MCLSHVVIKMFGRENNMEGHHMDNMEERLKALERKLALFVAQIETTRLHFGAYRCLSSL